MARRSYQGPVVEWTRRCSTKAKAEVRILAGSPLKQPEARARRARALEARGRRAELRRLTTIRPPRITVIISVSETEDRGSIPRVAATVQWRNGNAIVCKTITSRLDTGLHLQAAVAQWTECGPSKLGDAGSTPAGGANFVLMVMRQGGAPNRTHRTVMLLRCGRMLC